MLVKDSMEGGLREEEEDVWREITFMGNEAFRVVEGSTYFVHLWMHFVLILL